MRKYYKPGSWNVVCDVCGFHFKAEQLKKRWDGLMVCDKDFEFRNPQDFIRIPKEHIAPPWSRPEPDDTFVSSGNPILTEAGPPIQSEQEVALHTEN